MPLDFFALLVAGAVAYFLRTSTYVQRVRPAVFELDLPLPEYMQLIVMVSLVIIGIFALLGLYGMDSTRKLLDEFTRIFSGISIGVMLVILYIFLSAELFQSRFIVMAAYLFAVVFVMSGRYFVRRLQRYLLSRGVGIHRVVLAGNGPIEESLRQLFLKRPLLGYKVVGVVPEIAWDALEEIHRLHGIDEIIQTNASLPESDNLVLLDFSEQYKIDYKYVPNMFETYAANVRFRTISTIPIMELSRTPLDGWGRVAKRAIDVFGSLLGLVLLSPLFLLVAFLIRRDTPGPVFYKQIRVGRNMKPFEIIKFRSMFLEDCIGTEYGGQRAERKYEDLKAQLNERTGPLFKMKDDPRITKMGKFIRHWRIDELPQLLNVFKGEMSLFGPRPHLEKEVVQYDKYHRKLFTIKPGMSGMAQVAGNAGLSFEEEAKLDIAYIEHWSLWLDVVILLKTFKILLTDKNAV